MVEMFRECFVELNVDALPRLLRRCFLDGGCLGLTSEITDWLAELLSSQLLSWPKARRWSWPSSAEPGWESQVNISVCLCVFVYIRALTKDCFTVRTLLVLRVAQTNILNNFTIGLGAEMWFLFPISFRLINVAILCLHSLCFPVFSLHRPFRIFMLAIKIILTLFALSPMQ